MTIPEPARAPLDSAGIVVPEFIPNQRGHLELSESVVLDGEMLND